MRTDLQCIPCLIKQAIESTRLICHDPLTQEQAVRQVLAALAEQDYQVPPPVLGALVQRILRQTTANKDPYHQIKQQFNSYIKELWPRLGEQIERSKDPLATAIRIAAAGNEIDFGVRSDVSRAQAWSSIQESLGAHLSAPVLRQFRQDAEKAKTILYLADNAGEICCDRLLIELLGVDKVILGVRGSPVINDVTREDAQAAGLTELVQVIDNGNDIPGSYLPECDPGWRQVFDSADLVLAKGQGNFETLADAPRKIYFLFKVKCVVAAREAGRQMGELVFMQHQPTSGE